MLQRDAIDDGDVLLSTLCVRLRTVRCGAMGDLAAELRGLWALRTDGALTAAEFADAKRTALAAAAAAAGRH
eukprot:gene27264-56242_t